MDALFFSPFTGALTKAGAVAGTTNTLSTANTVQYGIKSLSYTKAALTNQATPIADATTGLAFSPIPINNGSVFFLAFDALGNLKVAQGQISLLDSNGNFTWYAPQLPVLVDSAAPFAYLVVKVGATGSAWTFGTSNLSGVTGVTYSFQDVVGGIPHRPVVA